MSTLSSSDATRNLKGKSMSEVAEMEALMEQCDSGDDAACDRLSSEEGAKKAWLSKLDVPSWGKLSSALSEISLAASEAAAASRVDENAAEAAWLEKQDRETVGR